jgi:hypothetical protein
MREALRFAGRLWRSLATGFCFSVFGLGQLLEAFLIFPLLILILRKPSSRHRAGKWVMRWSFKGFVTLMRA